MWWLFPRPKPARPAVSALGAAVVVAIAVALLAAASLPARDKRKAAQQPRAPAPAIEPARYDAPYEPV